MRRPMTRATGTPSPFWVHTALVAVQLAFASHHVASKIILRELAPGALSFLRAATAAVILLLGHLATRGVPRVPLRDVPLLALSALLGIAANQVLFFEGLARTTAINASILTTTIPVFTLIASLALRREAARVGLVLGIALAALGVLYLLGIEAFTIGGDTALGDALIVANALSYGIFLVVVGPLVRRHGALTTAVWLFVFGAFFVAPYGAPDLVEGAGAVSSSAWLLVAWVILAATLFTYVVNGWALRYAEPSIVAIYIYLQPVAASVLAVLVLGEHLAPRVVVAALLVFLGIYLVTRRKMPRPPST